MQHVVCVGVAAVDIKALPNHPLLLGDSTMGSVRLALGGVARNMATCFALLGLQSTLLGVVGTDWLGDYLLRETQALGVEIDHVCRISYGQTPSFVALLDNEGTIRYGIFDGSLLRHLTVHYLQAHQDVLTSADLLIAHSNIPGDALVYLANLAASRAIPLYVNSTSAPLAERVRSILHLSPIISANRLEAEALTGLELGTPPQALQAGQSLVIDGAREALLTLGTEGVVYCSSTKSVHYPAPPAHVIDATGAGDALCSCFLASRLLNMSVEESIEFGLTAAMLTVESPDSVFPSLSWEALSRRRTICRSVQNE